MRIKRNVDTFEKVAGNQQKAAFKGRNQVRNEITETEKCTPAELLTVGIYCRLKSRGLHGEKIAKESRRKAKIKKKKKMEWINGKKIRPER